MSLTSYSGITDLIFCFQYVSSAVRSVPMAVEIVSLANQGLLKMLMTARNAMLLGKLRQVAPFVPTEALVLDRLAKLVRLFVRLVLVLLRTTVLSVDLARTLSMGHAWGPAARVSVRVPT